MTTKALITTIISSFSCFFLTSGYAVVKDGTQVPPNSPIIPRKNSATLGASEVTSFTLQVTYDEEPLDILDDFSSNQNCIKRCTIKLMTDNGGYHNLYQTSWEKVSPVINVKKLLPEKLQLLMVANPKLETVGKISYDNGKLVFPNLSGIASLTQDFHFKLTKE